MAFSPAPSAFLFNPELPSPCFVIDLERLRQNMGILDYVQQQTGVKILLALKCYAAFATFPLLSRAFQGPLWGTCASSVDEARLGREEFCGEVHAFAAAWSDAEMRELMPLVDHITFNSVSQWRKFRPIISEYNAQCLKDGRRPIRCGFRVNPEHSEGAVSMYNPCAPGSRLGIRENTLLQAAAADWQGIDGLHFHTLCEQDAPALERTLKAFAKKFSRYIPLCRWLNWGGGHHITREGYDLELLIKLIREWQPCRQIYLEPGEAVALNAGWLIATVLDIVEADKPVALLDISAACHTPDVLEMPYTPPVWQLVGNAAVAAAEGLPWRCRLAGKSCLAGDVFGDYSFARPLKTGDILVFGDMAIYSMVKTTTFNGLRLPGIALLDKDNDFKLIRSFSYEDFRSRLS